MFWIRIHNDVFDYFYNKVDYFINLILEMLKKLINNLILEMLKKNSSNQVDTPTKSYPIHFHDLFEQNNSNPNSPKKSVDKNPSKEIEIDHDVMYQKVSNLA